MFLCYGQWQIQKLSEEGAKKNNHESMPLTLQHYQTELALKKSKYTMKKKQIKCVK